MTRIDAAPQASAGDRYASARLLSWWDQEKVAGARIMVVGAGALGNEVLKCLALLGIGSIFIVDFDRIEISNVSRSVLYRVSDKGRLKAVKAAARVRQLNPDVEVQVFNGNVADIGLGVFRRMNVLLGCLDNRAARCVLSRASWRTGVPYVDGALNGLDGSVKVFIPPVGACYECGLTAAERQWLSARYSCVPGAGSADEGQVPTTITSASVIAAVEAQEAVKLLHGLRVDASSGFLYSGIACRADRVTLTRRPSCGAHASFTPLVELPRAVASCTPADLLREARARLGEGAVLEFDRQVVTGTQCLDCGAAETGLSVWHRDATETPGCPKCGGPTLANRTHVIGDETEDLDKPLSALGFPALHIVAARRGEEYLYFELSGDAVSVLSSADVPER